MAIVRAQSDIAALPDGVRLGRTGMTLPKRLTLAEWQKVGAALAKLESGLQWWIGDWYNHGELEYGEKAGAAKTIGEEVGQLAPETVRKYAWVAKQYEIGIRIPDLTFAHHQHVAALDDRLGLLCRAKDEQWSASELRRHATGSEDTDPFDATLDELTIKLRRFFEGVTSRWPDGQKALLVAQLRGLADELESE